MRNPGEMGAAEVERFLTHLAADARWRGRLRTRRSMPWCFCNGTCWRRSLAGSEG
ncbi:MAG: hypothetical protein ACR2OZ_19395 [Verrucomicrobiales bacterium]